MKYLKSFSKQLRFFRETHQLDYKDIADICGLDASVVQAWETSSGAQAVYPSLENLLDICFKTGASLEYFIDVPETDRIDQLELPGLASHSDRDLSETLEALDEQMNKILPSEQELELLRRFRRSDEQNRELIMQLIGS